jgi:hypothetical protein
MVNAEELLLMLTETMISRDANELQVLKWR